MEFAGREGAMVFHLGAYCYNVDGLRVVFVFDVGLSGKIPEVPEWLVLLPLLLFVGSVA